MRSLPGLALGVSILALAGCGDGKAAAAAATTKAAAPPEDLQGTYATTLRRADVPADPPPELADQRAWIVKITPSGGVDDGPALTLTTVKHGCPDKVAETIVTSEPWKKLS